MNEQATTRPNAFQYHRINFEHTNQKNLKRKNQTKFLDDEKNFWQNPLTWWSLFFAVQLVDVAHSSTQWQDVPIARFGFQFLQHLEHRFIFEILGIGGFHGFSNAVRINVTCNRNFGHFLGSKINRTKQTEKKRLFSMEIKSTQKIKCDRCDLFFFRC